MKELENKVALVSSSTRGIVLPISFKKSASVNIRELPIIEFMAKRRAFKRLAPKDELKNAFKLQFL